MDAFQLHVSKLDKPYVSLRYMKQKLDFNKLVHFFRVVEICLISAFIWRNVTAVPQLLPISEKISKEYFHEFLMFLSSPKTVFLIGNAIVGLLFAESKLGQTMSKEDVSKRNTDVYDEYIQLKHGHGGGADHQVKSYKRSKSDSGRTMECRKKEKGELRRSGTETKESCKQLSLIMAEEQADSGNRMSDDEFRDMVEAFIARQQRNLRHEF